MKKLLLLLTSLLSLNAFSQITLENTYSPTSQWGGVLYYIKTSSSEKFAVAEEDGSALKIYNMNHSLYKNITIPTITVASGSEVEEVSVLCISDDLFNLDSKFEFVVTYFTYNKTTSTSGNFIFVYNEDGTVLFSKDSADIGYISTSNNEMEGVIKTSTGTKFLVRNMKYNNNDMFVYALPGNLTSTNQPLNMKPGLSYPFPNPSSETTRIAFELPQGIHEGEVIVFNTQGMPIKKYIVDNTFSDLVLNNADLAPGTYYYQLKAGGGFSDTQKMMVIK